MQIPLQITYRGMKKSEALDQRIRAKAAKLEVFHPRITSCRVAVEERHRHRQQGNQFTVRLDIRVPQTEIAVNRDHHEDVYVALRDAFDAARRKLEDFMRVQRGEVKAHEVPLRGKVARLFYDEGYGFIAAEDGQEFYFGTENVIEPSFERLEPGETVQFVTDVAGEGLQAKRITVRRHAQEGAS
jgi:ribosomal subunit interface protein